LQTFITKIDFNTLGRRGTASLTRYKNFDKFGIELAEFYGNSSFVVCDFLR